MTRRSKIAWLLAALCVALWGTTAIYWFLVEPPIVYETGADAIKPTLLRPGDDFRVMRSFEVKRDVHLFISRALVQGDCKRTCEIVDVSQGYSWVEKGTYKRWREHRLPNRVEPGRWTFQVTARWQDRVGFSHTIQLAPLEITVIPR